MEEKVFNITLKPFTQADKAEFIEKIQESFGLALKEQFSVTDKIPSQQELNAAFNASENETLCILNGTQKVGGAVIRLNPQAHHNWLELFFIYAGRHGGGLGLAAWKAIEQRYPQTKIWETVTPYFEKRNIHFYVNKCGFQIVEFCTPHHLSLEERYNHSHKPPIPGTEEFFRFQKIMTIR